ncbi:hypothetical protein [Streptomyces xylophagus]|uniref:hypothetical protein n=1 Tax=Streptomyces xylophagus TaxID=285514 RepID=UPI0009978FB3|nr:hypothetical protein [Streptomyces xylophagus]
MPRRIVPNLVLGLASAFLLGACGSSTGTSATSAAPPAPTSSAPAPSAPSASAAADTGSSGTGQSATTTSVTARAVNGMGIVVTDDKGLVLYRYDKDEPNPSKWTCSGACTKTWIPVIVPESVQTSGVEQSLLGTVHRNGETQLTLAGWPLYRYVGDTEAGQANGQGKDKEWYAVTPAGQKSTATAAPTT